MSQSLRQIMAMNVYNAEKQEWQKGAPETLDTAVYRADGSTVAAALDAIPGAIAEAVTVLKGGVAADGDTLAKLQSKITAIQTALDSDDVTLDTLQEVVDYIKANKDALELLGGSKVNVEDIANDLTTVVEGKILDARQGKALKDLIDALQTAVTGLQNQAANFATKVELNAVAAGAIPVISETPPANPVNGQVWLQPIGTTQI